MKLSIKFFIITFCIFSSFIQTSARLTQENLHRLQHNLPLKSSEFPLKTNQKPLTRQEQHKLGVSYLRSFKSVTINEKIQQFCAYLKKHENTKKSFQEKFQRTNSSQRYQSLLQYFQNQYAAKS